MKRDYNDEGMLKSNGIVFFPPVKEFSEALSIYKDCGGVIISLEEDGFLIDEPIKICRLYDIKPLDLELYFTAVLKDNGVDEVEIGNIISVWKIEEDIDNLEV